MESRLLVATTIALVYLAGGAPAFASQELPIHLFASGKDGTGNGPALLVEPNGSSYGVDTQGGRYFNGQVFKLFLPPGGITWTKSSIYAFTGTPDGVGPRGKLVAGPNGSLYGTTQLGGESGDAACSPVHYGCGTAFQLIPPAQAGAPWTKTVIHSFSYTEGEEPHGLIIDAAGNLYGTTNTTVFELRPPAGTANWTLQVLHRFGSSDGTYVNEDLLLEGEGHLFGSTPDGGLYGHGTVFELTHTLKGWLYARIHNFAGAPNDGGTPNGGLRGGGGDIWGTTQNGGMHDAGVIFDLRQETAGSSLYTNLIRYTFSGGADGGEPLAGLFAADDGSYWGTASQGGFIDATWCPSGCGVLFDLQRKGSFGFESYVYSVASHFLGNASLDGSYPDTSLGADQKGSLYGITEGGGISEGTVFELASAVPVLPAATPKFSPAPGAYTSAQSVTIADTTAGATIHYTTNGTAPTQNSPPYTGAITVASTEQIRAIAVAPGYTKSTVASAKYTIEPRAAAPTFSPRAGTYSGSVSVSIGDTTPGATIHFTTDGSNPTTTSAVYPGTPIRVTTTGQIKAIVVAVGFIQSPIAASKYTITP
jgi:hypothetical protein